MTTTHLFVELLVIGFGALVWILLLAATLFGYEIKAIEGQLLSWSALFPLLSLAYVFGILTDRVADWIFARFWDRAQLRQVYGEGEEDRNRYFEDRRTLIVESPELWHFVEYGRSRLRICRGWTLNSVLLLLSMNLYLKLAVTAPGVEGWRFLASNMALLLLTGLCWISWSKLNRKEYEKIQRQACWVRNRSPTTPREADLEKADRNEAELSSPSTIPGEVENETETE